MRKLILLLCFLFGSAILANETFRAGYDDPRKDLNKERFVRNAFHLHYINRTQPKNKCAPTNACKDGLILPVWEPQVSRGEEKFI
jgi:hypothetical protein